MKIGANLKLILEKSNLKEAELILFLEDNPYWKNTIDTAEIEDGVVHLKKGTRTNEFTFSKFLSKIAREDGTVEITDTFTSVSDLLIYKNNKNNRELSDRVNLYLKETGRELVAPHIKTIELLTEVFGHKNQNLGRACENMATLSTKKGSTSSGTALTWDEISKLKIESDEGYKLSVVHGKDIWKVYHDNTGGVASCMTNAKNQLKFYAKLPNKIRLVCVKNSKGVVKGRALLWHLDNGEIFMDRRYTSRETEIGELFEEFISKSKVIYRKNDGSYNFYKDKVVYTAPMVVNVVINFALFQMPYLDTFTYNGSQDLENADDDDEDQFDEDGHEVSADGSDINMSDNETITLRTQNAYRGQQTQIDIFHSFLNNQINEETFLNTLKGHANPYNQYRHNNGQMNSRFLFPLLEKNPELLEAIFENTDGYTLADLMVFHPEYMVHLSKVSSQKAVRFLEHSIKYNDYSIFKKMSRKMYETKDFLTMLSRNITTLNLKKLLSYKSAVSALNRMSNKGKLKFAKNFMANRPLSRGIDINHILLFENVISQLTEENLEDFFKSTKSKTDWEMIFNEENAAILNRIRTENIVVVQDEKKNSDEKKTFFKRIKKAIDVFADKQPKVEFNTVLKQMEYDKADTNSPAKGIAVKKESISPIAKQDEDSYDTSHENGEVVYEEE